ncbi:9741_t:CDS:2, partial [Cetraspora pellucida]
MSDSSQKKVVSIDTSRFEEIRAKEGKAKLIVLVVIVLLTAIYG